MIAITDRIALDEAEIVVTFIRASGPGGQNVNKVSSAAQLRFNVRRSPSLPDAVRLRLERIAGARTTKDGEIVLTAYRRSLTQPPLSRGPTNPPPSRSNPTCLLHTEGGRLTNHNTQVALRGLSRSMTPISPCKLQGSGSGLRWLA